jgi:glycosyltransferase involved in cell wall biosynthesis
VCVSDALADRLEALTGPLGTRRHVISAGFDGSVYYPGDREVAAAALGWDAPGPRICQLGNLVEIKNPLRLLEAFAALRAEQPDASLALVGGGELAPVLRARAAELGLGDAVRLPGEVPPAEAGRWLRAAHAACLASLREGFGLAAVEALASARPVAISTAAGAASVVADGVTGALLDPGDTASITAALTRAAALEPGATALAAAAPYALARESERLAKVLSGVARR